MGWYRKAAANGSAEAHYWLGICHFHGEGVDKDLRVAVKEFKAAAQDEDLLGESARELAWILFGLVGGSDELVDWRQGAYWLWRSDDGDLLIDRLTLEDVGGARLGNLSAHLVDEVGSVCAVVDEPGVSGWRP